MGFIFFRSKTTLFVIPAKAGIQFFGGCLDSRLRGNDENLFRIGMTSAISGVRPWDPCRWTQALKVIQARPRRRLLPTVPERVRPLIAHCQAQGLSNI